MDVSQDFTDSPRMSLPTFTRNLATNSVGPVGMPVAH